MAGTNYIYGTMETNLVNGLFNDLDAVGTTIKYCLLDNTYTFTTTHDSYDDISTYEVSGTGYSAGGVAVTSKTFTAVNLAGISYSIIFTATNPTYTTVTLTDVRYCVGYDATTAGDANKKLIHCIDLGEDVDITADTLVVKAHSSGLWYLNTRYY